MMLILLVVRGCNNHFINPKWWKNDAQLPKLQKISYQVTQFTMAHFFEEKINHLSKMIGKNASV